MQHHLRHAARLEYLNGRVIPGPLGSASTRRGTCRFTAAQSSTVGRRSPAECAIAGRCSSRFVDPPKAAWITMAFASDSGRQHIAHREPGLHHPHHGRAAAPRHIRPDRVARGRKRRVRQRHPERLADHLRVAAVPRN